MNRLDELRMLAGEHVPDFPPMKTGPVNWSPGISVDVLEVELGNSQVPLSGK